ncbi:MAG: putative peptidoglycan glycosyltransferase FtsW [Candidatus Jorgensenbacteria bacterium]|nr:putative peptidoglycan glycosyltransferase FtsW [Candidatus Jorgensenbacteria bacterium]
MTGKIFSHPRSRALPDFAFLGAAFALTIFGLVMLASASSDLALSRFGESYYYLVHQLTNGVIVGLGGFLLGAFVYYRTWEKFAIPLLAIGILALLLVFTPLGYGVTGGERWVSFGTFSFQPGELIKLTLIIYLASWLSKTRARGESMTEGLLPFVFLLGGIIVLLLLQPSTSTAVILSLAALILYFLGGARLHFIFLIGLVVILGFSLLVYFTPYRLDRVLTLLDPSIDPLGISYQANEAKLAIGSGGLTGVGFGKSTAKFGGLPETFGDSIFAIVGEEFGFVGGILLLALFLILILRGLVIAKRAPDAFGRLVTVGFIAVIGLQAFVNIAAISGLIPLTGVPLPFISYGGTALAVFLTMTGIVVNISRHAR